MASIDYKALYEAKCVETENLKKILKASHKTDKENIDLKYVVEGLKDENEELTEKVEELEEKVEELEENVENLTATIEMTMDNIKKCKTSCDGGVYGLVPQEEIEKLKAENDELWAIRKTMVKTYEGIIQERNDEIEKLKTKNESAEDFWTCIMDHICCDSKPDNPDELWVEGWCERKGIDGDKKKNLYEEFEFDEE